MDKKDMVKDFLVNEWIQRLIGWVISIVVSATLFYSIVMATVNDVKTIKPKVEQHEVSIIEFKKDLQYIKEGMSEQKEMLKDIVRTLKK